MPASPRLLQRERDRHGPRAGRSEWSPTRSSGLRSSTSRKRSLVQSERSLRMPPYKLMYRFGIAPWEWRDLPETWDPILRGQGALDPGRALDVGCGTGRDAVYLAKHGWRVTGVDFAEDALAKAKQRAADEGVQAEWIQGDVSRLDQLGLEPGYTLLYDFGCIQGLPAAARQGAADGLTRLAAPGASLSMFAFKAGRHILLPPRNGSTGCPRASRWRLGPRADAVRQE